MTRSLTTSQKSTALLLVTMVGWSTGALLIRLIEADPVAIAGWRGAFTFLTLLAFGYRPKFSRDKNLLIGSGAVAIANVTYVTSIMFTLVTNAVFLQATAIIHVALLGWFFLGEKLSRFDILMMMLVITGASLFFGERLDAGQLLGNSLALISGVAFGVYTFAVRRDKAGTPVDYVLMGNFILVLLCLPWMITLHFTWQNLLCLLALGVFQQAISNLCYIKGMQHARAIDAILISAPSTVFGPLLVFFVLGEKPGLLPLLGSFVVFIGVTAQAIAAARRPGTTTTLLIET